MKERLDWLLVADFHDLTEIAQEEVYYGYYELVYGIIRYIVKEHEATEDIIQDSFLIIVEKKPTFDHRSAMRSWLKTVARNSTINFLRKNKKYRNHVDTNSVYMSTDPLHQATNSVEQIVEVMLMEEAIMTHLSTLKPEYRRMVEYRWKFGMSYKEIADQLNICEKVVRQRLFRTREGIKIMLFKEWGESIHKKPMQSQVYQ